MRASVIKLLKRVGPLRSAAREVRHRLSGRERALLKRLSLFAPNSSGSPRQLADLALLDAGRAFPVLEHALRTAGLPPIPVTKVKDFPRGDDEQRAGEDLAELFRRHRSDKSTTHDYHLVYGPLLHRLGTVRGLVEIGLGTNNEDVVSNMTVGGAPGASLRAFRDFLPEARVRGADIDRRILFSEDRIDTYFVDQTNLASFAELSAACEGGVDLLIDDGLHSPAANVTVLEFGLSRVRAGGWIVVEDIAAAALPHWQVVGTAFRDVLRCELIEAREGYLFAAMRIG
ncbi:MAG TPA: hypothetical protein VF637_01555 [Sphingomicrobium sp.]